ncbi:MAG: laccase, partial [Acidobacteria bacterium]
ERADVIVDFTDFAGQTLILYNDAPTAFPALDPHYDYYTGAPDRTDMGANPFLPPGFGPNIRTVMQIVVPGTPGTAPADDYDPTTLANLRTAFFTNASTPGAFEAGQDPIVVGQTAYNSTYATTFPATWPNWGVSRISDGAISFSDVNGTIFSNFPMKAKAIHDEMGATFDDYGRMSAKLGLELPFTNAAIANFILQNYVDPPTEIVEEEQVQIWRVTHNGVDTHPIHFHLFDVQVLNRVGWDGFIRLPDDNELGWKDTVRMAPLEDTIVALRPKFPTLPFKLPNSVRPLNPAIPLGSLESFSQIDTTDGADLVPPQTNVMFNLGDEYVWHCHILSHEENDMMRAVSLLLPPAAPVALNATSAAGGITLTWTNTDLKASKFTIQRATNNTFTANLTTFTAPAGNTYLDTTAFPGATYYYRIMATNAIGPVGGTALMSLDSGWSNTASGSVTPRAITSIPAVAWNPTNGQFQIAYMGADMLMFVGTAQANGQLNNDFVILPFGRTPEAPAIAWDPIANKVFIAHFAKG